MAEGEQIPDWVTELRDQQQGQGEEPPIAEGLGEQMGQADMVEEPQEQVGEADVLEDLREQMAQVEEDFEYDERPPLVRTFSNLEPWQRFVLAVLLFLNVALCGCMALAMAGRVMPPF
jgi:spore cortex formation protein SpoVR/YcgB (stage V sporulation)